MKVIIAPDKFKGSLSSFEVCDAIQKGLGNARPGWQALAFPMADGGDGFAAVLKYYRNTSTINCSTVDPLGRSIQAVYEWDEKNVTAIIEMAVASGLVLLKAEERNPLLTSTYGTGLLVKDAVARGAKRIILGLGGSATNDAGTGILSAMGFRFLDDSNKSLPARGESLTLIKKIDVPRSLPAISIEIACDVQNVLHGPAGAAYVYGPQKGADPQQVEWLDKGLVNFAGVLEAQAGHNLADIEGTGAAGGIAAGLLPFFDVEIRSGIAMVVEASAIGQQLAGADLLITGEGRLDEQSGSGKVVGSMVALARRHGIPAVAICGQLQLNTEEIGKLGLQNAWPLQDEQVSAAEAMKNARRLLIKKMEEVAHLL